MAKLDGKILFCYGATFRLTRLEHDELRMLFRYILARNKTANAFQYMTARFLQNHNITFKVTFTNSSIINAKKLTKLQ